MGNASRRHHVVPNFYLEGFSRNGTIRVADLATNKTFTSTVVNASVRRDFYSVDGSAGPVDTFEKLLARIESEGARSIKKIKDGVWPLQENDRRLLARYIAVQATRVEWIQGMMGEGLDRVRFLVEQMLDETNSGEEAGRGAYWEARDGSRTFVPLEDIRFRQNDFLASIVSGANSIEPMIGGRPWVLMRLRRRALVTSDSPIGLLPGDGLAQESGVGFLNAAAVTFPISRKLGLLMIDPLVPAAAGVHIDVVRAGSLDHVTPETTRMEKLFNHSASTGANQMYFHPDDERYLPE